MQNNPPLNNASGDDQLLAEQELNDLTLKQNDSTLFVHSHEQPSPDTLESAQPAETAVPPVPDATDQPADPAVQDALPLSQNQSIAPIATPTNVPVAPAAQPNVVPATPQPVPHTGYGIPSGYVVSQGYIVPQGYVVSQGYVVPQGYVVHQGYVVPESYVQPSMVAPQGSISTTPQPGGIPAGYPQQGSLPQTGTIPQPGYVPQSGYAPQPGYVPQPGAAPPIQTFPPGFLPPPEFPPQQPRAPRDKSTLFVIGSVGLVVLILLGVILGVFLNQSKNATTSATPAAPAVTSAPTSSVGHPTSAFQTTSCPFSADPNLLQSQQVSCGVVTVPENRSAKNGKTVKLALAIFKPQQYISSPDPTPVIRLDGGPGGPSLSGLAQVITASNFRDFIFDHEVIMFDQRGTGYSTPSLNCPEQLSLPDTAQTSDYDQATHKCYDRLVGQGIDLNGFNSLQNAADVADIIHALGYRQMTLYGVSYGTRLALTTMRLYPSVVRATVLDSVYPPNHNRSDLTSDAQRVFQVLFDGCTKNPNCASKYPNLQTTFYALVDQLNSKPITFYTVDATTNQQHNVTLTGDNLIGFVFTMFYVTSLIPAIPQIIAQIKAHQYMELATLYGELGFDDTLSAGFFYSVECGEDWPFLTQESITQSEQGIEPHLAKAFGQQDEQDEYNICQFWKVDKVPSEQKQPVVSTIPTLITTGEYDPITPPDAGQEAGKTLSHSYFFEFPGQGHGQLYSSPCSNQIIAAFENTPTVQPNSQCISQMPEPQFI